MALAGVLAAGITGFLPGLSSQVQAHGSAATQATLWAPGRHIDALNGADTFADDETLLQVQAVASMPAATRPTDPAALNDWIYVVTDRHVVMNGRWADAICPAFREHRTAPTPNRSLAALRGILFQRLSDKRRVHIAGVEIKDATAAAAARCLGVIALRGRYNFQGVPVAFATDIASTR
jgi:hypothetical protein